MAKLSSKTIRHQRIRKRVTGTAERPRLSVHFSERNIYVQVIDAPQGVTLASACGYHFPGQATTLPGGGTQRVAIGRADRHAVRERRVDGRLDLVAEVELQGEGRTRAKGGDGGRQRMLAPAPPRSRGATRWCAVSPWLSS